MSTDYDTDGERHFDEIDAYDAYRDQELMGPPQEEPELYDEPPVDLAVLTAAWERIAEAVQALGVDGAVVAAAVPEALAELQQARHTLDRLYGGSRQEYTVTDNAGTDPTEDAELVTGQQIQAVLDNTASDRAGWVRNVHAEPWQVLSKVPPF